MVMWGIGSILSLEFVVCSCWLFCDMHPEIGMSIRSRVVVITRYFFKFFASPVVCGFGLMLFIFLFTVLISIVLLVLVIVFLF